MPKPLFKLYRRSKNNSRLNRCRIKSFLFFRPPTRKRQTKRPKSSKADTLPINQLSWKFSKQILYHIRNISNRKRRFFFQKLRHFPLPHLARIHGISIPLFLASIKRICLFYKSEFHPNNEYKLKHVFTPPLV